MREIKVITGVRGNVLLAEAVRGVPAPEWTRRPRAMDAAHARARELRARGYTLREIAVELGVSTTAASDWTSDMSLAGRASQGTDVKPNVAGLRHYWSQESPRREARRRAISVAAASEIGVLSDREVLLAGAIAYWCEGSKNKPYRRADRVAFINSDPALILFFLRFLAVARADRQQIRCSVSIHESADVAAAEMFWREVTGLPAEQFGRTTLKRHIPKKVRTEPGRGYHGCLVIRVRGGSDLYRRIEGWASAAMERAPVAR